jgi:hypothetical protein
MMRAFFEEYIRDIWGHATPSIILKENGWFNVLDYLFAYKCPQI